MPDAQDNYWRYVLEWFDPQGKRHEAVYDWYTGDGDRIEGAHDVCDRMEREADALARQGKPHNKEFHIAARRVSPQIGEAAIAAANPYDGYQTTLGRQRGRGRAAAARQDD